MSQHRRRPSSRRRTGRRVGAFLISIVVAASVITAIAAVMISRLPGVASDPLADTVAQLPASQSLAKLEGERQKLIIQAAAAQTFSVASSPKLTSPVVTTTTPATQPVLPVGPPPSPGTAQSIAYKMLPSFGFSASSEFPCLDSLWNAESGWRYNAENASGAYGIPQALPGSKMATAGADWQTNPATQIRWGLGYIQSRYGSPCAAWSFWQANGWY